MSHSRLDGGGNFEQTPAAGIVQEQFPLTPNSPQQRDYQQHDVQQSTEGRISHDNNDTSPQSLYASHTNPFGQQVWTAATVKKQQTQTQTETALLDLVELIIRNATNKSSDGKITRSDFLNKAARVTRFSSFPIGATSAPTCERWIGTLELVKMRKNPRMNVADLI
ncbi:putative mitochondrial carrier [Diplodia seriata]|uniref:Putative mitochondrial carrier n=1 Tax=Diplodia seriata TaxID=420778 RepID=A0A0G2GGB9_9PEZI|nr:putative mitochondrial carrier [Diplodia seriata]